MPDAAPPPAWDSQRLTNPHAQADKRTRVQSMFSAIAPSYDLNNRLHSFWRDQAWRRKAVKLAGLAADDRVVDVACGTGDLTMAFAQRLVRLRKTRLLHDQVIGVDFTYNMLPIAGLKAAKPYFPGDAKSNPPARWDEAVKFVNGDAQQLPLPDACCDVVSIAFGIRNVQQVDAALAEFYRVLRPGGRVIVLEFSEPTNPVLRTLNRFYCGRVMPVTATLISRDTSGAYKYLPKSVETFLTREQMLEHLGRAGFGQLTQHPLTFGVCVCYRGEKR